MHFLINICHNLAVDVDNLTCLVVHPYKWTFFKSTYAMVWTWMQTYQHAWCSAHVTGLYYHHHMLWFAHGNRCDHNQPAEWFANVSGHHCQHTPSALPIQRDFIVITIMHNGLPTEMDIINSCPVVLGQVKQTLKTAKALSDKGTDNKDDSYIQ